MMIKGSVHWESITILNTNAPDNRASKYIKEKWIELKGETDQATL